MASAVIHLCVAKKVSEHFHINNKELLLGSIAPDLSKQIGADRRISHFLNTPKKDVPNIQVFLDKYRDSLDKSFNLGYFIHLYTDKIWFDEFMSELVNDNVVRLIDDTIIQTSKEEIGHLIYNDYTNLNIDLIDYYKLDLSLFYEDFILPDSNIDEIPLDKLDILLEKMATIIMNSKMKKEYVFDMNKIINFIEYASDKIINKIYEYNIKVHH